MEPKTDQHIVLFDGVCNLCNRWVQIIIKRDPSEKFKFAALQSEAGKALLKRFLLSATEVNSVVYIKGDKYYLQSSAILQILKELGGVWKLTGIFLLVPIPIRDFVYNLIAKSRYRVFGRRTTCMIPPKEVMSRFLG